MRLITRYLRTLPQLLRRKNANAEKVRWRGVSPFQSRVKVIAAGGVGMALLGLFRPVNVNDAGSERYKLSRFSLFEFASAMVRK